MPSVPCLVTLRPLCKIFLAAPGADQTFLVSDRGRIFLIFWLRIVHLGLVLLRHMIRQFKIYLNFQNFCVHSRPLARSAAHPQLRVLRSLIHGTVGRAGPSRVLRVQSITFRSGHTSFRGTFTRSYVRSACFFMPLTEHTVLHPDRTRTEQRLLLSVASLDEARRAT